MVGPLYYMCKPSRRTYLMVLELDKSILDRLDNYGVKLAYSV